MSTSYYNKAEAPSARTTVRRHADRAAYDVPAVRAILDEAFIAHVAVATSHGPIVLPTAYARVGDEIVVHGARSNAILRMTARGAPVCITVTLVDGLVLAKSAMHHSINYRSVVIFGLGREVTADDEKARVLADLLDHIAPGRSREVRAPTDDELEQTRVVAFSLDEASVKQRGSGVADLPSDLALPAWSGVLPLHTAAGEAEAHESSSDVELPAYARAGPWRAVPTSEPIRR